MRLSAGRSLTEKDHSRTVVVASRLFTPETAAAAFRMSALADALARSSAVDVLTSVAPGGAIAAVPSGVTVSRAPVLRDRSGAIRGVAQYLSFDIPLFFRLLFRRGGDVLVAEAPPTTGIVTLVVARLKRIPFAYYPGDVWTDAVIAMGASRFVTRAIRAIESRILRSADLVLAVSPEVSDRFVVLGSSADRVVVVGNGIDLAVFDPQCEPMPAERPYFVYTGTMSEWQRPELFIEALAMLDGEDDIEIRYFGQGSAEAAVREAAARLAPGRVQFHGLVPPSDAARWIRGAVASLVSIVPGIGYDFARPTKTYAAAAVGTPVLFAGPDTGADIVRVAALGEAVEFDPLAVSSAMSRLMAAARSGQSEAARTRRAAWAQETVSLRSVGRRAADAILALRNGRRETGR